MFCLSVDNFSSSVHYTLFCVLSIHFFVFFNFFLLFSLLFHKNLHQNTFFCEKNTIANAVGQINALTELITHPDGINAKWDDRLQPLVQENQNNIKPQWGDRPQPRVSGHLTAQPWDQEKKHKSPNGATERVKSQLQSPH